MSRASLADQAYHELKRRIIRCQLAPGRYVREAHLVREVGIGKTPVREALARLVQEGLVRNNPQRGYQVSPISLRDVRNLCGLRLIIEPEVSAQAAGRIDPVEQRRLEELARPGAYDPSDPPSVDAYLRAAHEFHEGVARATGNDLLAEAVVRLVEQGERMIRLSFMFQDRSDEVRQGHQELLAALIAGDAEAARRITREGLVRSERRVTDALLSSPALLSTNVEPPPDDAAVAATAGRPGRAPRTFARPARRNGPRE